MFVALVGVKPKQTGPAGGNEILHFLADPDLFIGFIELSLVSL